MKFAPTILRPALSVVLAGLMVQPLTFAASHREAPITALDQKADITDWFAFVSPEHPDRVVMILNVDPFLEPSNGPNYFPFDPGILYEMKVDNDNDGVEDVTFQFRFKTEIRAPGVFTGFVGGLLGIPPITALDGPGSQGLNLRQVYSVTMVTKYSRQDLAEGQTLYAVPSNVEAAALFQKRYAAAPHAENLFALAEALQLAGRKDEAAKAFSEFEQKALKESALTDNATHELVAYYTDYAKQPAKALRIAEQELARRHDVYTLDAYAWALAANGQRARAREEMQKVLAVGVRDPKVRDHASRIAEAL